MSLQKPILISLSPNTEKDDIWLAVKTLFSPWGWASHQQRIPELEKKLSDVMGGQLVTLTSSGRGALYEALRAAGIGAGDEVILQAFTCLAVPAAITWTGATPVYADINRETFNLTAATVKARITPHTKALIIQHTFGIPAPLPELLTLAHEHNLLIIEDVAHALGGTFNNQPLGSFGDIAILSFGRDKTISSVYGGAVATKHQAVHATLRQQIAHYPQPPVWWSIQQLRHPLIVNLAIPLYFTANIGKALLVGAQRLKLLSMAVSYEEKTNGSKPAFINYQFSPALLPLLERQIEKLPRYTERRRAIAQRYQRECNHSIPDSPGANWLRWPLRIKNRQRLFAQAKAKHVMLGDWYTTPVTPCRLDQQEITRYQPGSCPAAEQVAQEIVNLPTHPRLLDSDVDRIIDIVKNYDSRD